MSTTPRNQASHKEGRIVLAIEAVRKGQKLSIQAAARSYDVPYSTLYYRLKGRTAKEDSQPGNQKLTSIEEPVLIQWIVSMDERGQPPRL